MTDRAARAREAVTAVFTWKVEPGWMASPERAGWHERVKGLGRTAGPQLTTTGCTP